MTWFGRARVVACVLGDRESGDVVLVKAIAEHIRSLGPRASLVMDKPEQGVRCGAVLQALLDARRFSTAPGDEPPRAPHRRRAGSLVPPLAVVDARRVVIAIDDDGQRVVSPFRRARCCW